MPAQYNLIMTRADIQRSLRSDPGIIEFKGMKFLITDRPSKMNIKHYVMALKKYKVDTVVCINENSNNNANLEESGIRIMNLTFKEGHFAPQQLIDQWLKILRLKFQQNPSTCIAVHSTSGLGRASVLVALALIELGLKYEAAVNMIRNKLRGAINDRQLSFLERYKPKNRLKRENQIRNIIAAIGINPVVSKVNFQISNFSTSGSHYVRLIEA